MRRHTHAHARTYTHTHTYTCTYAHTRVHTHAHAHAHTHTHTCGSSVFTETSIADGMVPRSSEVVESIWVREKFGSVNTSGCSTTHGGITFA